MMMTMMMMMMMMMMPPPPPKQPPPPPWWPDPPHYVSISQKYLVCSTKSFAASLVSIYNQDQRWVGLEAYVYLTRQPSCGHALMARPSPRFATRYRRTHCQTPDEVKPQHIGRALDGLTPGERLDQTGPLSHKHAERGLRP
jgi:hypothetical protein